MTPERLAEIKKIRNCVPFIDNGTGVPETQAAIDDLLADNAALREELAAAERRRGGECDTCGGWICPPLRCAACMMTKRLTPDSDPGPLAADAIRQQDKQLAALREAVRVLANAICGVPELITEEIDAHPLAAAACMEANQ